MPIERYKGNFKGDLSSISIAPETGNMDIKFQIRIYSSNYDLSHPGHGKSHGWFFVTTYNTEEANTLL
jgi:nitrous-oxide reductase